MSDKPQSGEQKPGAGAQRKVPSFEDIMEKAEAKDEKPAPRPTVRPAQEPVAKKGLPSFEDIMSGAASLPAGGGEAANRQGRPPRPPRKEREGERRGPVVVRKPALGQPLPEPTPLHPETEAAGEAGEPISAGEAEGTAAAGEAQPAPQKGERGGRRPERAERKPPPPKPMAESMFAQPNPEEDKDFALLFAQVEQTKRPEKLRPGQKISGRVAHLGAEVAFLDLGGKGEAIIDLNELRDEASAVTVKVGDTVEGYILSTAEGTVVLTKSVPKGAGREALQSAVQTGVPVEGVVSAVNKGGVEVDLGGLRAFCPSSQIDIRYVEDLSHFVGQKLKFRVMEMRGGNAVLSRRAILEEERKGKAAELREKLAVGANLEGTVVSVRDFGAFVDLGGLEGLIHVSELTHARSVRPQDVVKPGQAVRVQVLRIDKGEKGEERIGLSLRALEEDPWDAMRAELTIGKKLQGKVARLQPFGAFVELFPGVDGLVHVSALSDRHVQHPREVVKEGETIWVQIEQVDDSQRRVSLRKITEEEAQMDGPVPPRAGAAREGGRGEGRGEGRGGQGGATQGAPGQKRARVGEVVTVAVDKVEPFGVFVTWEGGGKGLIPNVEMGTPRGTDHKKMFPPGTSFPALVLELDDRGRFRLSKVGAERAQERAEMEEYHRSQKKPSGKGFGTLGDLLKAKLQLDKE